MKTYFKSLNKMKKNKGYRAVPLSFSRRAVIASATVTRKKNAIHCLTDVDISFPRQLMKEYFEKTGEKPSFTAYIVACLANTIKDHPYLNSFIKGSKQIMLDDVTISVLVENDIQGEKVPEPVGIKEAQNKTYEQIHHEIREAQKREGDQLGNLSDMTWIRFIPNFLLYTFFRLADRNISLAKRFGKVAVTAVGMFSKDAVWFIPHGTATVLVTVGGIREKIVQVEGKWVTREHICLTVSFDHNIVDGAPAARFMKQFMKVIKNGSVLQSEKA